MIVFAVAAVIGFIHVFWKLFCVIYVECLESDEDRRMALTYVDSMLKYFVCFEIGELISRTNVFCICRSWFDFRAQDGCRSSGAFVFRFMWRASSLGIDGGFIWRYQTLSIFFIHWLYNFLVFSGGRSWHVLMNECWRLECGRGLSELADTRLTVVLSKFVFKYLIHFGKVWWSIPLPLLTDCWFHARFSRVIHTKYIFTDGWESVGERIWWLLWTVDIRWCA